MVFTGVSGSGKSSLALGLFSWFVDVLVACVVGAIGMSLEGMILGDVRRAGVGLSSGGS